MDDEKIQKTLEFILDNQAQFSSDIQELKELHKQSEKRISVLERATINLYNEVVETSKSVQTLSEKVNILAESQKETNERLDAVINVFEKYLDQRNGDSK